MCTAIPNHSQFIPQLYMHTTSAFRTAICMMAIFSSARNLAPSLATLTGKLLHFVLFEQRTVVLGGLKRITIDSYLALMSLKTSANLRTLRIWSGEHSFALNCIRGIPIYSRAFLEASNSCHAAVVQWMIPVLKEKQISFLIGITGWDIGR